MNKINVAVIGTGRMGSYHARSLAQLPQTELVAVCDMNQEAVKKAARDFFVPNYYTDPDKMLACEKLDAVVIAAPTGLHKELAIKCSEKGLHILLEKPMAATVEECEQILNAVEKNRIKMLVGHIERFNPVVQQLKAFLDEQYLGEIFYIETVRSGPFPKRLYGSRDGVVIDLAVHDLDLIAFLLGDLKQVYAHHITTDKNNQDIYARIMYKTKGNTLGSSEFSWISPRKTRSIAIYGDKGLLVGNLLDQEVWFYENGDVGIDLSDNYYQNVLLGRMSEGKVIKFPVKKEEPLRNEHNFFASLILEDKPCSAVYGKMAVTYSLSLLESAKNDQIIYFS